MKKLKLLALTVLTLVVALLMLNSCGHEHVFSEATCTAPKTCECGMTEGEPLNHTYVNGTCACGAKDPNYVEPHEHSYETVVTAPTCTEAGYTTYTCACGDTYKGDEVAAKGHSYETSVTAPTCTEAGYTTYTCACGDTYKGDEVAATGHKFINNNCSCGAEYVAAPSGDWALITKLKDGDRVLIGAPAFGKLLSANKVSSTSYYNKGVDYSTDNFANVTDAEIFVVTVNEDGSYTFASLTGDVIALAASYSSLNKDGEHKSWTLTDRGDGTFLMKNIGRNTYLEWYSSKDNWSTYTAGNTNEYYLSFYAITEVFDENHVHNHITTVVEPTCTEAGYTAYTCACGDTYQADTVEATGKHKYDSQVTAPTCTEAGYTTYTCACGDTYKGDEVVATGHKFVEGKCACGAEDPDYVKPEPTIPGGTADFESIVTSSANGDSSYTKTFTTANGWIVQYCAIQCGGPEGCINPQYVVVGPDNTHKAICLVGKTSTPGKLTSPTLNTGISKLTINYTKIFSDTALSVTVTITDAAGNKYTHVIENLEMDKNDKQNVYVDTWVLETPIVGNFTIEVVNNCPSQVDSNKDRFTILDLSWEGAAAAHTHEYATTTTATCTAAGVTTYTCECGDTYTEEVEELGHVDENLDVECDREGCTSKVAPPANSVLSNFTANCLGSKISTSALYYVQGTIVEVLDAKNGIFLIDDGTGEKFYFRLPVNADGVSHANWAIKLTLGDKVSVYGKINKYSTSSAPNGQFWPAIQGGLVTILEQHPHDYTTTPATCSKPAFCACGQSYGEPLGCADTDGDQLCDDCGKNVNYIYEYVEIRTDNESGVLDTEAGTYTWSNDNFDVQVTKGTSTQLYTTAKDHMRVYKNNAFILANKNGIVVKTITVYLTNATQIGNFEKFLTGYTYTKDEVNFSVTIEINSGENITFNNPGSTTQIKGVEFGYEKPNA